MGSTGITSKQGEEEEQAFLYAMQLASACVLPMVLKSAIELDLLELIKKAGPDAYVSAAQLASQLPDTATNNPEAHVNLDRMLRLLASYSVLNCKLADDGSNNNKVERLYGLAPVCRFLTKNEDGVSVAPYLLLSHDRVLMESWYHLKEAVVDGGGVGGNPFKKAHGMTGFQYMGADPRFGALFNAAMSNPSTILMKKVLETYRGFQGLNSLVDIGGGTGASLHMIVSRYPSIKGTNFDLPHVVRAAPSYPGVEHVGGDVFESAIPKADAIFIKWVAHNWNDEHVLKLLKNCYDAIPPEKGKVILADSISPEMPDTELSTRTVFHVDMIMLAHVHGGRERTEMEFRALSEAAGFKQFLKVCRVYDMWIMELRK